MAIIAPILAVFAFVCFVLASLPLGAPCWNRLISAGLGFWVLIQILGYSGGVR